MNISIKKSIPAILLATLISASPVMAAGDSKVTDNHNLDGAYVSSQVINKINAQVQQNTLSMDAKINKQLDNAISKMNSDLEQRINASITEL